jgi:hypothetical protein
MKKCRRYDDVVIDLQYKCVCVSERQQFSFFFVTQLTNTSSDDD